MSAHTRLLLERLGKLKPVVVSERAGVKVSQYQGIYNDGFAVVEFTDEVQCGEKIAKVPGRALWACGILRHMKGLLYEHSYIPSMLVGEAFSPTSLLIDFTRCSGTNRMISGQVRRVVGQAWRKLRVDCSWISVKFGRTAEGRLVVCNVFDHTQIELRKNGEVLIGPNATPEQLRKGYEVVFKLSHTFAPVGYLRESATLPTAVSSHITFE